LVALSLLSLPLSAGTSPPARVLAPQLSTALSAVCAVPVRQVRWSGDGRLVFACADGVVAAELPDLAPWPVVPNDLFPGGIRNVSRVALGGGKVLAFEKPFRLLLWDEARNRRVWARQKLDFLIIEAELVGDEAVYLGWWHHPEKPQPEGVAVWMGPLGGDFSLLRPVHRLPESAAVRRNFRAAWSAYGGAIEPDREGGFAVITTVAPGVHHYDRRGRLIEVLGAGLDELVVDELHEAVEVLSSDLPGRYGRFLNRQPMPDDLLWTADGPAILVRRPDGDRIAWELWYPGAEGVDVRLGLSSSQPNAHMDCDLRGSRLACVYSDLVGSGPPWQQEGRVEARLVTFELPRARR
jgi:hypothetical protein